MAKAQSKAHVVADEAALAEVARAESMGGSTVTPVAMDLRDAASIVTAFQRIAQLDATVTCLVNCAGVIVRDPVRS